MAWTASRMKIVFSSKMCLVSKIGEERERTRGGGGREHSIVIERGRHRQTWLPWENRLCTHCSNGEVKEEFIFLTECNEYKNISETYFSGTEHIYSVFTKENKEGKLSLLCETMHKPNLPVSTLLPHIEKEYHITVNNKYNINMYCSFFSLSFCSLHTYSMKDISVHFIMFFSWLFFPSFIFPLLLFLKNTIVHT